MGGRYRFHKTERILKPREFREISRQGQRFHNLYFLLIIKKNSLGKKRLGITVSRKIGKSVKRNSIKRIIREFFRLHKDELPPSTDFLVVAKKGLSGLTKPEIRNGLVDVFHRI